MIMIIITKLGRYSDNDNRYQLVVSREAVAILIMIMIIITKLGRYSDNDNDNHYKIRSLF